MSKLIEVEAKCCEHKDCVDCEGSNKVTVMIDPDQLRKLGYHKLDEVVIDSYKLTELLVTHNHYTEEGINKLIGDIIITNPITLKESEYKKPTPNLDTDADKKLRHRGCV